jgi:hypothetical protein
MIQLIKQYGLWLVLGAVFVAMYWYGQVICSGEHSRNMDPGVQGEPAAAKGIQSVRDFVRRLLAPKIEP